MARLATPLRPAGNTPADHPGARAERVHPRAGRLSKPSRDTRIIGFHPSQPEAMVRYAEATRALTHAPFNMNLFVSKQPRAIDAAAQRAALDAVAGCYKEPGLPRPEPVRAPHAPYLEAQLRAIEEIRPAVFTFHLGGLPQERIRRFQTLGVKVGGGANCIAEARHLEELGVDCVVARGAEAGGHRRSYLPKPRRSRRSTGLRHCAAEGEGT